MWGWKAAGTPYMAVDVHALSQRAEKQTNKQTKTGAFSELFLCMALGKLCLNCYMNF